MNKRRIYPLHFTVVAIALFCLVYVIPNVLGIFYSFTDLTKYGNDFNFVGFDNYRRIFSGSENYITFISNTFIFTIFTTLLKMIVSFVLALLLVNSIKGRNFFRGIIFSPAILSFLVTGLIFKSFLHPTTGFLNQFLRAISLGALAKGWLIDPQYSLASCIVIDTWRGAGYLMTIMIAGLQSIPNTYYEAATIDGAGYLAKLRHVTIPLLMPAINVTLVLNIVYGLSVFDIIYVLTNGGPANSSGVINTAVFTEFAGGYYAMANALSTVMFLCMGIIAIFITNKMNKKVVELS